MNAPQRKCLVLFWSEAEYANREWCEGLLLFVIRNDFCLFISSRPAKSCMQVARDSNGYRQTDLLCFLAQIACDGLRFPKKPFRAFEVGTKSQYVIAGDLFHTR